MRSLALAGLGYRPLSRRPVEFLLGAGLTHRWLRWPYAA